MDQDAALPLVIFNSSLLDPSGQPNLVMGSSQCHLLIWTLLNNQSQDLVVTPFQSGTVDQNQYHFGFDFAPGALATAPSLQGWDVYPVKDNKGAIKSLYVALSGSQALRIGPGGHNAAPLMYTDAIQEDSNSSRVAVTVTTGRQVTLGGTPIPGRPFGPRYLTLVQANTPTLSVPPLSVDFVGRRTVINDGNTSNSITFALTNMTQAHLTLTPEVLFAVWFDAAPDQPGLGYPWALARIQDLTAQDVTLTPPSPAADWNVTKLATMLAGTPVNAEWHINPAANFVLKTQEPVLFTFSGLKTDLDPGFTRMYLRFENLPGFRPGVLMGALEKTPLLYGSARGQGLYVSSGTPKGNTVPAPVYHSGLYIEQFGAGAAAIFNGGKVGIGTGTKAPAATLHIMDADQNPDGGTLILESSNSNGPGLKFGCQADYAWLQSHAGKALAINPTPGNVGIGTATPGSSLSVNGGAAIGSTYAQHAISITANDLAVEGKVGIGTASPGSRLSVDGGVAIGKEYAQKTTTIAENSLAVEGHVGIGVTAPNFPLSFPEVEGDKICLWGQSGTNYGFGIASSLLQIYTADSASAVACGYGSSSNFTQTMRIKGDGTLVLGVARESQLAFTTGTYSGFGDNAYRAEISNDTKDYQALMLVGNRSRPGAHSPRWVQAWDHLEVKGNLFVSGKASVFFADYNNGTWWSLGWRGGNNSAWYDAAADPPAPSDLRMKSELQSIPSALDRVQRLRGVTYRWNEDALRHFTRDIEDVMSAGPNATERENQDVWQAERDRRRLQLGATQIGVVAQEVEAVLPEAVTTDAEGYKSVRYDNLIPLLIEAIKEQSAAVTAQAAHTTRLQSEIEQLKQALLAATPGAGDRTPR